MSKVRHWKTALLYSSAILLGIVFGRFAVHLPGERGILAGRSAGVHAAEAAPVTVEAPDSPDAVYVCTPSYIGEFGNRIHVLCTVAAPGGISYFAAPTSDSKNAARVLSIMLTAKSLGKNLQIYYNLNGSGAAYGCQTNNCRPITAIEMMN